MNKRSRFQSYFPILYYAGEFFVILFSTEIMLYWTYNSWSNLNNFFIAFWFLVSILFRSHLLGYNSYYNANSKCFHRGGVSSEKNKEIRQTNYLKSRLIYFKKHFSYSSYLIICFLTFIELFPRIIFFLLKFSVKDLKAMVLSYYNLICWLLRTNK